MTFIQGTTIRNTGRTRFKKGGTPWNKGLKTGLVPKTAFKKGEFENEKHLNWKGDAVSYVGLHQWVRRKLGRPERCIKCSAIKNIQWANKSHEYKRDLTDWLALCRPCHMDYDQIMEKAWRTRRAYA